MTDLTLIKVRNTKYLFSKITNIIFMNENIKRCINSILKKLPNRTDLVVVLKGNVSAE